MYCILLDFPAGSAGAQWRGGGKDSVLPFRVRIITTDPLYTYNLVFGIVRLSVARSIFNRRKFYQLLFN